MSTFTYPSQKALKAKAKAKASFCAFPSHFKTQVPSLLNGVTKVFVGTPTPENSCYEPVVAAGKRFSAARLFLAEMSGLLTRYIIKCPGDSNAGVQYKKQITSIILQ